MRVSYKDIIIECDWAVRYEDKVVLGARSKEVFFIKSFDAYEVLSTLTSKGFWKAENLGVVRCFYIDQLSDLLCENVFENAVFESFAGGRVGGVYNLL